MPSYLPAPSRRALYRHAKRTLYKALVRRWTGSRAGLDKHIRAFLRGKRHSYLLRLVRQHAFALAVATALLTGATAHASPPIELSDIAMDANSGGFGMNGETALDRSGWSVSGAGDVNGDGIPDLIVGAGGADPNGSYSGKSYVVFGKADGTAEQLSDIAMDANAGGFAMNGEAAKDDAGKSVSGAGDVNGDGLDDLIVGALGADPNGSYSGRSYVVFGKADGTAVELSSVAAGAGGFVINGEAGDGSAWSVSGAGDVNGDGLADLIVGAPEAGGGAGRSYVIFGKVDTTAVELSSVAAGTGGFAMNGEATSPGSGDLSGGSVSGAGDVNGDGLADLIVGAQRADPIVNTDAGKSYVVFGKVDGTAVELSSVAAGTGGFVMNGVSVGDRSGRSVSGAGDVNGDGLADLIVASDTKTYVVFGKASSTAVELSSVAAGTGGFFMNTGANTVSDAGDVNGDGLADLIVANILVFGKADGTAVEISSVVAGTGGFVMNAAVIGDYTGFSVSGAGDVNGDGLADLIVGAPTAAPNGYASGKSYVVFSPETAPESASYKARSRVGDGPGGAPVVRTVLGDARATIDYSDDDFADNGSGGASLETVTLTRNSAGISNLIGPGGPTEIADVVWQIETDRVGFDSAEITLKYTNTEIGPVSAPESELAIYTAPALSGPWSPLATTVDTARNTVSADVTGFSFFAIGDAAGIGLPLNWKLIVGALLAAGLAALGVWPLRRRKRRGTLES